jgi:hypothetical protein
MEIVQAFIYGLSPFMFGFLALTVRYCFKSKCVLVKCCGCVEIQRDVESEMKEEEKVETNEKI